MASSLGMHYVYIPYQELAAAPVTLRVGQVPVTIVLASSSVCNVSIPPRFVIVDSMSTGKMGKTDKNSISATVNLGTSFVLSYSGNECEVRLGRKITVTDQSTYIQRCAQDVNSS